MNTLSEDVNEYYVIVFNNSNQYQHYLSAVKSSHSVTFIILDYCRKLTAALAQRFILQFKLLLTINTII